jgi:uncharacterized membrane protein YeiH
MQHDSMQSGIPESSVTRAGTLIVRIADLGGTFVFAIEGALAALAGRLDPIGVLVLAFLTALGGGIVRDLLIGARPPAAIADWSYMAIVLAGSVMTWLFHAFIGEIPLGVLIALDAAGLALFVVAGTQKSLDLGIHPLAAIFLGTVGGVGGGAMRDVVMNEVPRILRTDIYATAAVAAAVMVVTGRLFDLPQRAMAIAAALVCFCLRLVAVSQHWHLPIGPA